ncbi:head maturation protease, ClpP-related [Priestia aryabhattai]|uniref:head maturation protease, ClpP-related n=1 Tax=Priestia aryabhattai TaxID=412384 RepID=UPI002E23205F|nr:head maturation protease, ClpP-related [Priestia aryabhattai]MED3888285.1 Clp protease ClpP [Priestia aryabhattai]MED4262180.1 Clp protease ClpP [Priestia aryabhattai]
MPKFWNFVKNETSLDTVELRIDGDIVSDNDAWMYEWFGEPSASPNAFRNELSQYKDQAITLWIDSYGGDVFAAAGIYNALKSHNGKIVAKIDGKAMSAASVIAMAADEILMSPVGLMMIHNPLTGVRGDMRDLRKAADVLDTVKDTIINAYTAKTNKSRASISALMDDETYMSADEAVKNGFADGIIGQEEEKNNIMNFSFNRFAIMNSANESMQKMLDFEKARQVSSPSNSSEDLEAEKEKLLMELELI